MQFKVALVSLFAAMAIAAPELEKRCTADGGSCTQLSQCCSGNCEYDSSVGLVCRPAKKMMEKRCTANGDDLYSKDTRFMYELIQNAEDNSYEHAISEGQKPFLKFSLYPDRMVVDSNEDGFTEDNVKAICNANYKSLIPFVSNELRKCKVPTEVGSERILEDLYIPLPRLKALVREIRGIGHNFALLPKDIKDEDEGKWMFLKQFGVTFTDDLQFYLKTLRVLRYSHECNGLSTKSVEGCVFKIYGGITSNCRADDDIDTIRLYFNDHTLTFVPNYEGKQNHWLCLMKCVWNGPAWLEFTPSLRIEANFHVEVTDGQLKLYVPVDKEKVETCYLEELPKHILSFLGLSDHAAEALLIKIFGSSSLDIVDYILEKAGIVDVKDVRRPVGNDIADARPRGDSNTDEHPQRLPDHGSRARTRDSAGQRQQTNEHTPAADRLTTRLPTRDARSPDLQIMESIEQPIEDTAYGALLDRLIRTAQNAYIPFRGTTSHCFCSHTSDLPVFNCSDHHIDHPSIFAARSLYRDVGELFVSPL
ncbi:hypothetical protein SLS54_006422 [Diplodia seriata]